MGDFDVDVVVKSQFVGLSFVVILEALPFGKGRPERDIIARL